MTDPSSDQRNATLSRLRPRTPTAWATVILSATFAALWIVFAVRAVDRYAANLPTITPPAPVSTPDLRATVDAANRLLFPDRSGGTPAATPIATPAASPIATPVAAPSG